MARTFKVQNGDIMVSAANGRPTLVEGIEKLRQDIVEFFTVSITPTGFGAGLEQLIGLISMGSHAFTSIADKQIRDGIVEFRKLQRSNTNIPRTPDERIVGVTGVQVEQDSEDPTKYFFRANIVTESGKTFPLPVIQIGAR